MKTTAYIKTLFFLTLVSIMFSCQKVVVLDLNTAEPMLVIEGNVTTDAGPQMVFISTSGSYYTAEGIEPIGDATVMIKDGSGLVDTLEMYTAGLYYSYDITVKENVEYNIEVQHNGEIYTGSEVFPAKKKDRQPLAGCK